MLCYAVPLPGFVSANQQQLASGVPVAFALFGGAAQAAEHSIA